MSQRKQPPANTWRRNLGENNAGFTKSFALAASLGAEGFREVLIVENAVNCDTAQADIAHLQHEKKSTDERVAKGVFSIMPIGLALNIAASADESDSHKEIEINEYNKRLSERIEEIKQTCGINNERRWRLQITAKTRLLLHLTRRL